MLIMNIDVKSLMSYLVQNIEFKTGCRSTSEHATLSSLTLSQHTSNCKRGAVLDLPDTDNYSCMSTPCFRGQAPRFHPSQHGSSYFRRVPLTTCSWWLKAVFQRAGSFWFIKSAGSEQYLRVGIEGDIKERPEWHQGVIPLSDGVSEALIINMPKALRT